MNYVLLILDFTLYYYLKEMTLVFNIHRILARFAHIERIPCLSFNFLAIESIYPHLKNCFYR